MPQGPGAPLTHLQLCDDAVLIVLILDGRGHDGGCGGRAGHLGHGSAQLHLGLLHLQLLRLGLLQGPGPHQDQALAPSSSPPRPYHFQTISHLPQLLICRDGPFPWRKPKPEVESPLASLLPFLPLPLREGTTPESLQRSSQACPQLSPLTPTQAVAVP